MKITHIARTGTATLAALLALGGVANAASKTVTLRFAAVAGSEMVHCGHTLDGLGSTKTAANIQDFRLYVSGVKLIRADGKLVKLNLIKNNRYNLTAKGVGVTLLDFENGTGPCAAEGDKMTNTVVRGTVPKGNYVGVQFKVGVPSVLNHTDPTATPAPLNLVAMGWSWQSGRKFAKIELVDPNTTYGQGWKNKAFMVHLGSTGCTGNPAAGEITKCLQPNRAVVTFKRFNFDKKMLAIDVARLVSGTDITVNQKGAPGCMSGQTDPECPGVFSAFGIDWKADGTGTGAPLAAQRLFRIIR